MTDPRASQREATGLRSDPEQAEWLSPFNSIRLRSLRKNLARWYRASARPLPWRGTRDPYAIWISEIMLQQTTVAAVQPYFRRFLEAYPTVAALAGSDETEVLRLWQGLGYYSRARNLRMAARRIVEEFGGQFPETVAELQSLPGIGRYTAGAIVSFAYNRPAPIVEANTLRLYARLLGYDGDPRSKRGSELLWAFAERVLPDSEPGAFNQALMELGSQVCKPSMPDCPNCPISTACRAFEAGTQHMIPVAAKRPVFEDVIEHAVVVRRADSEGDRYLLLRWQPGERWAGLWDFVRFGGEQLFEAGGEREALAPPKPALSKAVRLLTGIEAAVGEPFHTLKHGVTRFRITLVSHTAQHVAGEPVGPREFAWVSASQLDQYPLSTSARKVAEQVRLRSVGLFAEDWLGEASLGNGTKRRRGPGKNKKPPKSN